VKTEADNERNRQRAALVDLDANLLSVFADWPSALGGNLRLRRGVSGFVDGAANLFVTPSRLLPLRVQRLGLLDSSSIATCHFLL
jgi:hypothetical protein